MRTKPLAALAMVGASSLAAQADLAVRGIEHFPGDADARAKLVQLGFVTLPGKDPAMHRAYGRNDLPPLVTVDVALHAVILQQRAMLREIESRLAPVLAAFCARGFALASARADQSTAFGHAARFLGLARRAHGDGWQPGSHAELLADASAEGPWLCIDPSEFEPSSAYQDDLALQHYFAARRWLGTRRFTMRRPTNAACARALATLVRDDAELRAAYAQLQGPFDAWLGPADVDVMTTPLPESGTVGLLPGRELPCDRTLGRVADAGLPSWPFSILAAGALRSAAGRELVAARHGEAVAAAIDGVPDQQYPPSLYVEFLRAVASVHEPLPTAAPALFHSAAWRRRLCETQLGAWLTMYEIVSAHSPRTLSGSSPPPPGYVAPYPQTFRAVAKLARELEVLAATWDRARVLPAEALPPRAAALEWRADAARDVFATLRDLDASAARQRVHTLLDRRGRGEALTEEETAIAHAMASDLVMTRRALLAIARNGDQFARIATRQLRGEPLAPEDLELFRNLPAVIKTMTDMANGEDLPVCLPFRPDIGTTTWLGTTKHDALYAVMDLDGTPTLLFGMVYGVAESERPADQPWQANRWIKAAMKDELPRPAEFGAYRGARQSR